MSPIIHSDNHFSIVLCSGKKLFQVCGVYVNSWEGFAPHFSFIDDNVEYVQEEDYFDKVKQIELNYHKSLNQGVIIQNVEKGRENDLKIKSIFTPKYRENKFPFYYPSFDKIQEQAEQQLNSIKGVLKN